MDLGLVRGGALTCYVLSFVLLWDASVFCQFLFEVIKSLLLSLFGFRNPFYISFTRHPVVVPRVFLLYRRFFWAFFGGFSLLRFLVGGIGFNNVFCRVFPVVYHVLTDVHFSTQRVYAYIVFGTFTILL